MRSQSVEVTVGKAPSTSAFTRLVQVAWVLGPLALAWLLFDAARLAPGGPNSVGPLAAEALVLAAWAGGLAAAIRLRPVWLTFLRAGGAAGVVWGGAAVASGIETGAAVLGWGLIVIVLAFSPQVVTDAAGRESAPRERRFPLAIPLGLLLFMVIPSTLVAGGGLGFVPAWLMGSRPTGTRLILAVLGIVAAPVILVSLTRLSKRWLVTVPAGIVLHDPLLLAETYRLTSEEIAWVEYAPPKWRRIASSKDVADVTGGCASRPLIIVLDRPMPGPMTRPNRHDGSGMVGMIAARPVDRAAALATLRNAGYERPAAERLEDD